MRTNIYIHKSKCGFTTLKPIYTNSNCLSLTKDTHSPTPKLQYARPSNQAAYREKGSIAGASGPRANGQLLMDPNIIVEAIR